MKLSAMFFFFCILTGVCSKCRKLFTEAEKKTTPQTSDFESKVILRIENISLVRVNDFLSIY